MDRSNFRGDLPLGMGASAASAFVPGQGFPDAMLELEAASGPHYPSAFTGLFWSHVGSLEVAHQLVREGRRDWGTV